MSTLFEDKAEKALDKALLGGPRCTSAWWYHQWETQDCQKPVFLVASKHALCRSMPSYMHMYPSAVVENLVKSLQ